MGYCYGGLRVRDGPDTAHTGEYLSIKYGAVRV